MRGKGKANRICHPDRKDWESVSDGKGPSHTPGPGLHPSSHGRAESQLWYHHRSSQGRWQAPLRQVRVCPGCAQPQRGKSLAQNPTARGDISAWGQARSTACLPESAGHQNPREAPLYPPSPLATGRSRTFQVPCLIAWTLQIHGWLLLISS